MKSFQIELEVMFLIIKKKGEEVKKFFLDILGENGVLIFPSFPLITPLPEQVLVSPFSIMFTGLFNAFEFPSTQVPLGLNDKGLPIGLQVISRPGNDKITIAVALALEKEFGGWKSVFDRDSF